MHVNVQKENASSINGIEFLGEKKVDGQLFLFGKKAPVACLLLVLIDQAFFCTLRKKTETKKLSFFKKLRLKNEKKLKTEPKKLRSLEALCSGHSPKNSDYWRPYLVT